MRSIPRRDHADIGSSLMMDCTGCPVAGTACDTCMVPVLLALDPPQPDPVEVEAPDDVERAVLARLVRSGLVASDEAARATSVVSRWPRARTG